MKIQVNINDDVVKKIDSMAKMYGVTRSALVAVWLGQIVASTEKGMDAITKIAENTIK